MTSVGRCVRSMTVATEKVLPEPVMPKQHLVFRALVEAPDERVDGGRLVALRLEF